MKTNKKLVYKSDDNDRAVSVYSQSHYLVGDNLRDSLVGNIMMSVEVLGLNTTQEKALKDTIKRQINECFRNCSEYIHEKLADVLYDYLYSSSIESNKYPVQNNNHEFTLEVRE